jgi:hypothetical protein
VVFISGFHAAKSCLSEVRLNYIAETFVKHWRIWQISDVMTDDRAKEKACFWFWFR